MKKIRLKNGPIYIFMFLCVIGFIYSSFKIIMWKLNVDDNDKIHEEHNGKIKRINDDNGDQYKIDFESLKRQNPDTVAYIKVNNTNIDYIVVKGNDNEYYLKHNFNKKWNVAGWIFGDYHNKFDGSDKNLIIYGHDTKDGSMFGSLKSVLNKKWYTNKENHIIVVLTNDKEYKYQVFATYTIEPESYYLNTSFSDNVDFANFVGKLKSRSIYDYGVDISGDDSILTLSSCIREGEKRVVLHAKLIS